MYNDRIQQWETKLALVQQHLQPWTSLESGIPPWFRDDPIIHDLVQRIEQRIALLTQRISQQTDQAGAKSLESELDEIIELSRQFDQSLREQVSMEIWNDPFSASPAISS